MQAQQHSHHNLILLELLMLNKSSQPLIYSILVTPNSGQSVAFISFTSSNMTVLWQTNSNVQAGTYTVEIIGTISAATSW